jgi:hypothetical protein
VLEEPGAQQGQTAASGGADGTDGPDRRAGPSTRRRRRLPRWWLAAVAVVAVVVTAVALPIRTTVAVDELHRLDRRWAWYEAIDGQRAQLRAQLASEAEDPADPRVRRAGAALDAEEAPLLRAARTALVAGRHLPDGGLRRLRQAMAVAFADMAADLDAEAGAGGSSAPTPATTTAILRVVDLLNGQLGRWRQQTVKRPVAAPRLVAADGPLAELALSSDQPIDARLVLAGPVATFTSVDLGVPSGPPVVHHLAVAGNPLTGPIVARVGYLAVAAENSPVDSSPVYAVRIDLTGQPQLIGSTVGGAVIPGADPDGVWLQSGATAMEVNGTGAVLHAAVTIGTDRTLVGATERVLVTTGVNIARPDSDLEVVPLQGPSQGHASLVAPRGALVAAMAGHLAWLNQRVDGTVEMQLADGSGGNIRTLAPPVLVDLGPSPPGQPTARALPVDTGAFSPDGSRLVLRGLTVAKGGSIVQLLLVDVASGAIRLINGSIGDHPAGPIIWSPTGDRVFFTEATGRQETHVGTWQVGAPAPIAIRVPTPSLLALAVTGR